MVAEYSSSENKTNFYCNECFKYLKPEEKMVLDTVGMSDEWGGLTDEELDTIVDSIFKTLEN